MRWRALRSFEAGSLAGRRALLAASALACAGGWVRSDEPPAALDPKADPLVDEDQERQAIEAQGEKMGLGPFRVTRTANYLGIGDAVDIFRSRTLADCEAVRSDYIDYYRARGFDIAEPGRRLIVVTLTDDRSFAAFLGKREYAVVRDMHIGPTVHGVYQPRSNRLIVFDHRSLGPQAVALAGLENLFALAHEATHQLTFNTGLLERRGDVPLCISEGLATYSEPRKTVGRTPPGELNPRRLKDLPSNQRRELSWIPLADLLANDRLLRGPGPLGRILVGYAESWLLVHYLMSEPSTRVDLRLYLKAIRERVSPANRLEDARSHLGDLDRLNQEIQDYHKAILRERR